MMDNRTLLAIFLSMVILIASSMFFQKSEAPIEQTKPAEKKQEQTGEAPQKKLPPSPPVPQTSGIKPGEAATEKRIVIENDQAVFTLTSRGASIASVRLKKYHDSKGAEILFRNDPALPPLSVSFDDAFQQIPLDFAVTGKSEKLTGPDKTAVIVFAYSDGAHSVRRTYTFTGDQYSFALKDEVSGVPAYFLALGKNFGITDEKDTTEHFGPVVLHFSDRSEFRSDDIKETKYFREGVKWIAQEDKYFFAAVLPKGKVDDARVWKSGDTAVAGLKMPSGTSEYLVFTGPKLYDMLKTYGNELEYIVDFGWFSFLAVPLFWILKFFYGLVHNYGVAILILTVLVRIPFIPIMNKGQASMKKLQDIQPKINDIREKFKKDPQKMQKEIMEAYKQHKVNPMSGCLPMVLQIPVFFALYKVLLVAIELRGAPFALWITDLSIKDPYYVLPIVMGVTMVIQQKMTPSTMDPKQQKIMMFMPVFFTFLFLSFASGLVLYWLANNVLSIIQQFYVNRKAEREAQAQSS